MLITEENERSNIMSIDIEIIQKGLFKKKLDYKTIIGDLSYGVYENNRLTEGKLGGEFL